jgi:hypothetical protein
MNGMATSTAGTGTPQGYRARAVRGGRVLLRRLIEFHRGGARAQYLIWDRLCDFGDDQIVHYRKIAGDGRL